MDTNDPATYFAGFNISDLVDVGVTVTLVHTFPYEGIWTYRTPTGVVIRTDPNGIILGR